MLCVCGGGWGGVKIFMVIQGAGFSTYIIFRDEESFLQSRVWLIENTLLCPSHQKERYGGSITKRRNGESLHSYVPNFVSFMVDGKIINHTPIFLLCLWRLDYGSGSFHVPSLRYFSNIPSLSILVWYPDLNYLRPQKAETRCPMTTIMVVQFSWADKVGSCIDNPGCFTGIHSTSWPGMSYSLNLKSSRMKVSCRDFSTCQNYVPVPGVVHFTKCHFFCSEIFILY